MVDRRRIRAYDTWDMASNIFRGFPGVLLLALAATACGDDETEQQPPPETVTAATYNLGLAPGFVEATEGRTPVTTAYVAGLDIDLLCVQEVWFAQQALIDATAEVLPNTVFIPADPGMVGAPACQPSDVTDVQTCVTDNGCDQVCSDQLVSCALQNCGAQIGQLNTNAPTCYECVIANVGLPYEEIIDNCSNESIEYAFEGNFGQGILTSYDVLASDTLVLESTTNRRGVTYAQVDTPLGEIHAFCTHLTAGLSSVPYPVGGAYSSWEEEQRAQIDAMLAFIDEKAGDGQVLVMGDLNTGPAGDGYDGEMPDHYAVLIDAGFANPYESAPGHGCTFCADNPINAKASASDKPNSVLIDHILVKGFADGSASADYTLIGTETVEVENCDETVTTGYSDHYGLQVTLTASN